MYDGKTRNDNSDMQFSTPDFKSYPMPVKKRQQYMPRPLGRKA